MASQFGVTLAVSVILGVLAGQWLDSHLKTGIIFTLIGVLVGLVAAGTSTVRLYRATLRKTETMKSTEDTADDGSPVNARRL